MHNLAPEKTSNVGRDLDTDNALFHDVESNPGHGKQELGTAQRPRRRHSGIFGWLPSLDIDFLSRNPRHYVSHSIRPLFLRSAFFLLPSFLQSRIQGRTPFGPEPQGNQKKGGQRGEKPRLLSPTSYLDGMRGIAAFSVFLCHYSYTCFVIAEGWGSGGSNYYFLKLPFIRLFYSGPPMVCIFFVISGYALSLKPLKLIHSISSRSSSAITSAARTKKHEHNNYSKLLETLSSLVFRRGLRLFLPPAISTFLIVLLLRLGVYEWNRSFASDAEFLRNVQEIHYTRFDSATEQFVDWGYAVLNFVHLWDWDAFAGSTGIDVHLWTIPVEFRASMVLFLTILGTARLRGGVRMGVVLGWCVFAFLWERWEMCLFWMGMVLAEGDVVRDMAAKREEGRREGELPESSGGGILPVVEPVTLARMGDVMLIPQQGPKRSRRHPQPRQGAIEMSPDIYIVGSEDEASHSSTYPHSSNHPSSTSSRYRSGSAPLLSTTPISQPFESHRPPRPFSITTSPLASPAGNTILPIVLLIISLYLLSQPDINSHLTPGWITLTSLIPHWWTEHYRFYQSIGAVILVYAVSRHPSSSPSSSSASSASGSDTAPILSQYLNPKILFESAIAQYLGKISYAIYLVHGPVLHTLGYTVMKFTWTRVTGTETDGHYITGFLLASLAVVPLVVWVADVFWRGVDEPVVKFARRVEERVVFGC